MRKITVLAAAAMVLASLGTASAIDVKVNGQWQFSFGYYSRNNLMENSETGDHEDRTRFRQRMRTQVRFIADENLSALLNFEIGDLTWGGNDGGGLDADGKAVKVKHAYLDWTLPQTGIQTRIGVQGLRLPWIVAGNPVMDADVAGITVATQLTPELGLTVFYARPYDDTVGDSGQTDGKNRYDEMDIAGFMLPVKMAYVNATPWAMGAMIGKDSSYFGSRGTGAVTGGSGNYSGRGRALVNPGDVDSDVYGYWFGTTFELPFIDPFFVKIDAMAGGLETGDDDSDSFGYFIAADMGYKFSFGRLSLLGWYSSGDDGKDDRGIMPIISDDNGFKMTSYGLQGKRWRNYDGAFSINGLGMWGIGVQMADVSFIDDLKHTARFMYMRGTNSGDSLEGVGRGNKSSYKNGYFLTSDAAYEINLLNEYKVNKNLTVALDFAYAWLDLGEQRTNKDDTEGSFAAMLGIQYSF